MAPNLFFPGDKPPATIHGWQKAGSILRIAPGIYTDQVANPEAVVLDNWQRIVGYMLPNSVITDRSVLFSGPDKGVLFLARSAKARQIVLPGLIVSVRQGAGPVAGDMELQGGLFLASPLRGFLDNILPSRAVRGKPPRTLSDAELSVYIDAALAKGKWNQGSELLEEAGMLVQLLGLDDEVASRAELLLEISLGSTQHYLNLSTPSDASVQGQKSKGLKSHKHESISSPGSRSVGIKSLLGPLLSLRETVLRINPERCPVDVREARWTYLPFVEAFYMSGILDRITPKRLLIKEALRSVVLAELAEQTSEFKRYFAIVSDQSEMSFGATTADEFLLQLRDRHAKFVGISSSGRPGLFKDEGDFRRIEVTGSMPTIAEQLSVGFDTMSVLGNGLGLAIGLYYLISSVRPFEEANEQMSSITLNAVLSSASECRIIGHMAGGFSDFSKFRIDEKLPNFAVWIDEFVARQRLTAGSDYQDLGLVLKRLRASEGF